MSENPTNQLDIARAVFVVFKSKSSNSMKGKHERFQSEIRKFDTQVPVQLEYRSLALL